MPLFAFINMTTGSWPSDMASGVSVPVKVAVVVRVGVVVGVMVIVGVLVAVNVTVVAA